MDDTPLSESELAAMRRALTADGAANSASAAVRMRLLQEVRSLRRERRRAHLKTLLIAAVLTVATAGQLWYLATDHVQKRERLVSDAGELPNREIVTAFFPLRYSSVPMNGGRLLRVRLQNDALAAYGLDKSRMGDDSSSHILADVLVGDDGLARAVRFVRQSTDPIDMKEGQR